MGTGDHSKAINMASSLAREAKAAGLPGPLTVRLTTDDGLLLMDMVASQITELGTSTKGHQWLELAGVRFEWPTPDMPR
jgi:hypothetical protein